MTAEEIKTIVADRETERLTAQFCHQWQVACDRMDCLRGELAEGMDTNMEAEVYAVLMRMQSASMALMELNKRPSAYLFAECFDRMAEPVADVRLRKAAIALLGLAEGQDDKSAESFFDLISGSLAQFYLLSDEEQVEKVREVSAVQKVLSVFVQSLEPDELLMLLPLIQTIQAEASVADEDEAKEAMQKVSQSLDDIAGRMNSARLQLLLLLLLLSMIPELLLKQMMEWRSESARMASLLNKVLAQVREGEAWEHYWEGRRKTLQVVSDSTSWSDTLRSELQKEKEWLAQVPEGLFAKWSTDEEAFKEDFLKAGLDDEALRGFILHLACAEELGRELNPFGKDEKAEIVNGDRQTICDAVLEAAGKLESLVAKRWYPQYGSLWRELLNEEVILERLKVSRRSPHNNLFTARFFCHLVGEMKKSAIFGAHSDADLAKKLVSSDAVGTFRKNIQEGMNEEPENIREKLSSILQKYKQLASKR